MIIAGARSLPLNWRHGANVDTIEGNNAWSETDLVFSLKVRY